MSSIMNISCFRCPSCRSIGIEEVVEGVTYVSEIQRLRYHSDGAVCAEYAGEGQTEGGGEIVCYRCHNCGEPIPCDPDPESLWNWLAGQVPQNVPPVQTADELAKQVMPYLPDGALEHDAGGQLVIYTGMYEDKDGKLKPFYG